MKKFLSLLAITVLVLQSSVTTLVYAQETNQEETDSKPNVETLKESVDNDTTSGDVSDPSNNGSQDAVEETQNNENDELTEKITDVDNPAEELDDNTNSDTASDEESNISDEKDETDEIDETEKAGIEGEGDDGSNETDADGKLPDEAPLFRTLSTELNTLSEVNPEEVEEFNPEDYVTYTPGNLTYTHPDGTEYDGIGTITITDGTNTITILDRNLGAEVAGTGVDSYGYYYQRGNVWGFPKSGMDFLRDSLPVNHQPEIKSGYSRNNLYSNNVFMRGCYYNGKRRESDPRCRPYKLSIESRGAPANIWGLNTNTPKTDYTRRAMCPEGFHIPTRQELIDLTHIFWNLYSGGDSSSIKNNYILGSEYTNLFSNTLLIPLQGFRRWDSSYPVVENAGKVGVIWSSQQVNMGSAYDLTIRNGYKGYYGNYEIQPGDASPQTQGYPVRCFQDRADGRTTITFNTNGGTEIDPITQYPGTDVTAPADPTKQGYTFSGWDIEIPAIMPDDNMTITAIWNVNEYEITFVNRDEETVLQSSNIAYGETPEYTGETPTKEPDTACYYGFNGWNPEIDTVVGDQIYVAQYDCIARNYTITWKHENGTTLETDSTPYGTMPTYNGKTPIKEGDVQYSYTFAGWSPEVVAVNGDATYTAVFTQSVNTYPITFKNEDGTPITTIDVEYGAEPTAPATPTKPSDVECDYTFTEWTPTISVVNGPATYTARYSCTKKIYDINFVDEDGAPLKHEALEYGAKPTAPENPSKVGYTFAGWTPEVHDVTGPETYTAVYTINEYLVSFVDEDGTTVISTGMVDHGQTPDTPANPTKPATDECTYEFAGWTPTVGIITGTTTYRANYTCTKNKYTITFEDEDGTVISSDDVEYGKNPTTPDNPTKPTTDECTYEFMGWTPDVVSVKGPATYTAVYRCIDREYDINFVDEDGTPLKQETLVYGSTPTAPADPSKIGYTFAGWTPEVHDVTGPETYRATYTINQYTITFDTAGGTEIDPITQDYNTPVIAPANPTKTGYTFAGWDREVPENMPAENITVTAQWNINQYLITFEDDNGNVISTGLVNYGETPVAPENPSKPFTPACNYTFEGWNSDLTPVDGEKTYTAIFTCTPRQYTVTFDPNGGKIDGKNGNIEVTVTYNELVEKIASERIVHDNSNKHTFKYWSLNGAEFDFNTPITSDITLKAEWNINRDGGYSGGGRRGSSSEEEVVLRGEVDLECSTEGSIYPDEWNEAYVYACENGIIDAQNIMDARLEDFLTRAEMAKIVSMFAMLTNAKEPNKAKDCSNFMDSISGYDQRMQDLMVMSCQLEYMGIHTVNYEPIPDFMPNKFVSRAEFGTILSRILWGNKFEGTDNARYQNHLANLKSEEILENIDPTIKEKRGYVILMIYRAAKNRGLIKNDEGLTDNEEGQIKNEELTETEE